jgi:hypothetical protein
MRSSVVLRPRRLDAKKPLPPACACPLHHPASSSLGAC